MELWWIILAGCGGGLLLIAYVAFVIYKIVRHRKRKYPRDTEGLTDGRDWTVHINDHFERRVDGLCMDTISGSAKLRRKPVIPGEEEAVLQSIFKVSSPPNNPKEKHDSLQRKVADMSQLNGVSGPVNTSPQVIQRSEYTWENLLRQSSEINMEQSHTIHHDLEDYRSPIRLDSTTRSLNFDRKHQRQQQRVRSKSLRVYKPHEPPSNNAFSVEETLPFTLKFVSTEVDKASINKNESTTKSPKNKTAHQSISSKTPEDSKKNSSTDKSIRVSRSGSAPSVKARKMALHPETEVTARQRSESLRWLPEPDYHLVSADELISGKSLDKNERSERSYRHNRTVNSEGNKAQAVNSDRKLNRSGSAPSAQAKETVMKHEADGPPRKRSVSLQWIPEPDYQSVTVDELISAAQSVDKIKDETNVCEVDIHIKGTIIRDPEVGKLETEKTDNFFKNNKASSSPLGKVEGDLVRKFLVPGVAQRMPTDKVASDDHSQGQSHDTLIEIQNDNEETVLVKDRIQTLEHQISPGRPHPAQNGGAPTKRNLLVERAANPEIPAAEERKHESVMENPQSIVSSFKNPSQVLSIGKMKIVKNDEIRPWMVNQERSLKYRTRETLPTELKATLSQPTTINVQTKADVGSGPSTSDLVKAALRNQTKNNDINNDYNNNVTSTNQMPSPEDQVGEVSDAPPKTGSSFAPSNLKSNVPIPKDNDADLTLEERKKNWKREQMVDQLHSARQRNLNQNYIFGTGLAYQSCMPELQNRLKQLTLTK